MAMYLDQYDFVRWQMIRRNVDDFTHFTAAYPMESKSKVFRYFKIYESMITAHFSTKLSRFRCNNLKRMSKESCIKIKTRKNKLHLRKELNI